MLLELKVRNLAILEGIEITFAKGLNVLTGETGAGKSILLEALQLILGGRGDRTLIRTGQDEAWVEGLFEVDDRIIAQLDEWGIEATLEEPLALRRVLHQNGRSRAYINCVSVPAKILQQIAPFLVDFGRQHDQAILLNSEHHLGLLDKFAGTTEAREAVTAAHLTLTELRKEKRRLFESRHHRADRMEFLKFQREAIWDVDPQPGEEEQIEEELGNLSEKERQKELANRGEQMLNEGERAVQSCLSSALDPLAELVELDDSLEPLLEELQEALLSVEEAARTLRNYQKNLRLDRQHVETLRSRLDQILKLQQRYGGDFDAVMERVDVIAEELVSLEEEARREGSLDEEIEAAKEQLADAAAPLTKARVACASVLAERVQRELNELAMAGARFAVSFRGLTSQEGIACPWDEDDPLAFTIDNKENKADADLDESTEEAVDAASGDVVDEGISVDEEGRPKDVAYVEHEDEDAIRIGTAGAERGFFYLAANQGEELRPLERVASGGELSRILLALKRVLADATQVQTFVFDEIDAGVAGAAATQVAKKLRQIASQQGENAQILCISHTAQIAAEADAHIHVQKATMDGRTRTQVVQLTHEERVIELARMLAGDQSLGQAVDLARQLLGSASHAPLPEPIPDAEHDTTTTLTSH